MGTASAEKAIEQSLGFSPGEFKQNLYSFRKRKILTAEMIVCQVIELLKTLRWEVAK